MSTSWTWSISQTISGFSKRKWPSVFIRRTRERYSRSKMRTRADCLDICYDISKTHMRREGLKQRVNSDESNLLYRCEIGRWRVGCLSLFTKMSCYVPLYQLVSRETRSSKNLWNYTAVVVIWSLSFERTGRGQNTSRYASDMPRSYIMMHKLG